MRAQTSKIGLPGVCGPVTYVTPEKKAILKTSSQKVENAGAYLQGELRVSAERKAIEPYPL